MPNWDKIAPECQQFVVVVEELLEERKKAAVQRPGKPFLKGDFTDEFKFYVSIRQGATKSLPLRRDILRMADFLKCSRDETNRMLAAAHIASEQAFLAGEELAKAIATGKRLLEFIPFPAHVIDQNYNIHSWNSSINDLFNIPEEIISRLSLQERNVLRFIFDPLTPVYPVLYKDPKWWRFTAALNVHRFKKDNQHSEDRDWYKDRVQSLMDYPGFREIWEKVDVDSDISEFAPDAMPAPDYVTVVFGPKGEPITIRGLQIRYLDTEFPRIVAYIPDNSASQAIYTHYGLPTPDNWWGSKKD